MPKIAQAQSNQVQSQVVSQPRASGNVDPAAFGAPITQGLDRVAGSVAGMMDRISTTEAEEALTQFERDKNDVFFNSKTGYFNTNGRNAYDSAGVAGAAVEDLKKQYGDGLSEQARLKFDKVAAKHVTRSQLDISRHASKGLQVWEVATIESQVENTLENGSLYWSDPQAMREQRVLGEMSIRESAGITGIGPEATAEKLQNFRSQFASNAISAATVSSAVEGKAQFELMESDLEGPDRVKLQKVIDAKVKSEKVKSDATVSVLTSTRLVNQYDERGDVIEEVNKINDAELRKKTMRESMHQYDNKKKAEKEARGAAFEDAESHVLSGGSAETYQTQDPEGWGRMSVKQQKSIEAGKAVATDWNMYSDLMTLPKDQLAKIDPTDHYNSLALAQRKSLISAVKTANGTGSSSEKADSQSGRSRTAQTTAAVNQLFGKVSKRKKDTQKQVNAFYSLVDGEVEFRESELKRKLTSEEYTDILSGLTREVVQEGIIFDSEFDLTDVPADDISELSRYLRENNIPVTSDNLIKLHQQVTE